MLPEIRTIVYAADFSPRANEVFRYAMSLAERYGAKIVIVHAAEPLNPTAQTMVSFYLSKEMTEGHRREAMERAVEFLRKRLEIFCEGESCSDPEGRNRVADIRVVEGRPSEVICREAVRANADVIVMGSHGHTAVGEVLLGTTAHKVTQHASVPVLLVRLGKERGGGDP